MAGLKFVTVTVTKERGETLTTPKTRYYDASKIDHLENTATGGAFRYTPSYGAIGEEIETSTAPSTIVADANA